MDYLFSAFGFSKTASTSLDEFRHEFNQTKNEDVSVLLNLQSRIQTYISTNPSLIKAELSIETQFNNLKSAVTAQIDRKRSSVPSASLPSSSISSGSSAPPIEKSLSSSAPPQESKVRHTFIVNRSTVSSQGTDRPKLPQFPLNQEVQEQEMLSNPHTTQRFEDALPKERSSFSAPMVVPSPSIERNTPHSIKPSSNLDENDEKANELEETDSYGFGSRETPLRRDHDLSVSYNLDILAEQIYNLSSFPIGTQTLERIKDPDLVQQLNEIADLDSPRYISHSETTAHLLLHNIKGLEEKIGSLLQNPSLTIHHIDCLLDAFIRIRTSAGTITLKENLTELKDSLKSMQLFVRTKCIELLLRSCDLAIENEQTLLALPEGYEHYLPDMILERISLYESYLEFLDDIKIENKEFTRVKTALQERIGELQGKSSQSSSTNSEIGALFCEIYQDLLYYKNFVASFKKTFDQLSFYEQTLFIDELLQFESKVKAVQMELGRLLMDGVEIPQKIQELSQILGQKLKTFHSKLAPKYTECWLATAQKTKQDISTSFEFDSNLHKKVVEEFQGSTILRIEAMHAKYHS